MIRAQLVVKRDCSLCDDALAILRRVARDYPLQIEILPLEEHPELGAPTDLPHVTLDGQLVARMKVSEYRVRQHLRMQQGGLG